MIYPPAIKARKGPYRPRFHAAGSKYFLPIVYRATIGIRYEKFVAIVALYETPSLLVKSETERGKERRDHLKPRLLSYRKISDERKKENRSNIRRSNSRKSHLGPNHGTCNSDTKDADENGRVDRDFSTVEFAE